MTVTHTFQVTGAVVTPTLSGTISHNIPSSVTAGSNYSVTFGGKSATSGTVLYNINISSGSQNGTFTKTSGIAAGETIYLSVASNAPNSGTISGTITANTSPVGASNGPDSVGFILGTLAIVEPDPTFSGFNHTVPTNTQQGQSYTVTFSGTSSSNGHQVWYSLSPQTGLSFSKLDNISAGEAVTLTIGGSATGTLAVTVYANTTKNDGSTFTQSVSYIQTTVAVPVPIIIMDFSTYWSYNVVAETTLPYGPQYGGSVAFQIGNVSATDGSQVYMDITGAVNDGWTLHGSNNTRIPVGTGFTIAAPTGPASSSTSFPIRFYTDSGGSSNTYLSKFAPTRAWAWASTYEPSIYPWPFDSRNFPGHT